MFVNQLKASLRDVCFHVFTVRRVVPDCIPLSVPALCFVGVAVVFVDCGLFIGQSCVKVAAFQGIVVHLR